MNAWVLLRVKHWGKKLDIVGTYSDPNTAFAAVLEDNSETEGIGRISQEDDNEHISIRVDTTFPNETVMQYTAYYYLYVIDITHIVNNPVLEV